ncbi:MAG: methionyl-tRNA formyltransferase [Ignavibacteriae bacterium]|nr:methionyl-tRNA formyltransferase [Ignavibacteriota bacterium]MCB9243508.1 methionyl-tRNA formyltransferase [Ignavibacteriales bacterium]
MRIVFMGTPEFAVPSLNILLENGYDVPAVVTVPDKKKGRGLKESYSDVKTFALEKGLRVLQPEKLKDEEFVKQLTEIQPDLIVVVAFRILPREVYTIPKLGSFNLHASLLPKYRGAAPINWAIINGEKESGVTTFFLQDKVDTGNIILQKKVRIDEDETAGTLHDKLSFIGEEAVLETVQKIESDSVQVSPQDDTLASPAPKIFKEDCKIDWSLPAEKIYNFIRGLSPYPTAWTTLDGANMKIYLAGMTEMQSDGEPGSVLIEGKNIFVNTADKKLEITELQLEGKKRIFASDFINGLRTTKELRLN